MSAQSRVFVVRFGALGDVVLTPLLRVLHRAHPCLPVTKIVPEDVMNALVSAA